MVSKFISKTILLFSLILAALTVFSGIYYYHVRKIKIDKNVNIIICGDSHTECAINDSILKHSANISIPEQSYIYTFNILKILTKSNPQINTVIIGYSFHSLSAFYDSIFLHNIEYRCPHYMPILDFNSISVLLSSNPIAVVRSSPNVFSCMLKSLFIKSSDFSSYPFIGHYYASTVSKVTESNINNSIRTHYIDLPPNQFFSSAQEKYLLQIIDFCSKKHIKLILLNTPVNKEYYSKIPAKFIEKYYSFSQSVKEQAILYDFHDLDLPKNCYGDSHHINAFGAKILSLKLDSLLNK